MLQIYYKKSNNKQKVKKYLQKSQITITQSQVAMDTIGKRVNYFLEKKNISVKEFAEKTGISENMIYRLKSEERGLSSSSLARILDAYPDMDVKWLITGVTSQKDIITSQSSIVEEEDMNFYDDSLKNKVKMILSNEIVLDTFVEMIKKHNYKGKNYDL